MKKVLLKRLMICATLLVVGNIGGHGVLSDNTEISQTSKSSQITSTTTETTVETNENFGYSEETSGTETNENFGYSEETSGTETNEININELENSDRIVDEVKLKEVVEPELSYVAHVSNVGWQHSVNDSETAGTTGHSLGLEAIKFSVKNNGIDGKIEANAHVRNIGWMGWKNGTDTIGTTGRCLPIEAIMIKLNGKLAELYDVYYRMHVQNFGWLDWAKDGEYAGTQGYGYRAEAIEVKLLKKGSEVPQKTSKPFKAKLYMKSQGHVANIGWQPSSDNGFVGTTGRGLGLEAFKLNFVNSAYSGNVYYKAHVGNYGWQQEIVNNSIAGTTGQSKSIEAIEIRLTDEVEKHYDVYYRVHSHLLGWLGWVKNGKKAGTEGISCPAEAIEYIIVEKNEKGPQSSIPAYFSRQLLSDNKPTLTYQSFSVNNKWQNQVFENQISGTTGQSIALSGLSINVTNQRVPGNVSYQAHVSNIGWRQWYSGGQNAGVNSNSIEAVKLQLTGQLACLYNIYYRVHSSKIGWLGWTSNGNPAGTKGFGNPIEAIQIQLVPKNVTFTGKTLDAFREKVYEATPTLNYFGINRDKIVNELNKHRYDRYYLGTPYLGLRSNNAALYMKPGVAMNCTGFVARVFANAGGNLSKITALSNQWGGVANAYNWRDAMRKKVPTHVFNSIADLLNSKIAKKGDLIYFEPNYNLPNYDCHIGIYWGDYPGHNQIWHETDTNKISHIYSGAPYTKVFLFSM